MARSIYLILQEKSATVSEIAEDAETSIQNAQYHLNKLKDADLVTVVETTYSSKGNEMAIYAATSDPLVIVSGSKNKTSRIRSRLRDILGVFGILAVSSLGVEWLARHDILHADARDLLVGTVGHVSSDSSLQFVIALPPGLLFFLGGLVCLGCWIVLISISK
ncbi:ArsR/SmtB family transcription factor [Haladaptatus halobius]|uniref:ArsR/SmtB family transcription factor n=1 Tax=Haladaptatus halobius TaxID=2884875 RepID=UPI0034A580D2